jgi:hypothetical protein
VPAAPVVPAWPVPAAPVLPLVPAPPVSFYPAAQPARMAASRTPAKEIPGRDFREASEVYRM